MHAEGPNSFFKTEVDPLLQMGACLLGILVFSILLWIPVLIKLSNMESYHYWTVSASFALLYGVGNSVLSLGAIDQNRYWTRSILGYALVVAIGGCMAYLFSGLSIFEAKSYRWIYIVFTFGYLLFLSIVRIMRRIMEMVEKQDRRLRGED